MQLNQRQLDALCALAREGVPVELDFELYLAGTDTAGEGIRVYLELESLDDETGERLHNALLPMLERVVGQPLELLIGGREGPLPAEAEVVRREGAALYGRRSVA